MIGGSSSGRDWDALCLEIKRSEHEADHLLPSSADVKNEWIYTSTPPVHIYGMVFS
jgi:hypothetical protein